MTEYSFRGLFTLEGTLFRGLTDQGFEAWPVEGSTGAPDHQSQGLHGRAVQATLERGVRDVLRSVQGRSRLPSRGSHRGRASSPRTLSNGSEPRLANLCKSFMRRVHGPRAGLLTQKSTHWNPRASVCQAPESHPSVPVNLTCN